MTERESVLAGLIGPVGKYVRRRVRNEDAAADLAQDVLLKARRAIDSSPQGERFPRWVFRIARNTVIDHHRSRRDRGHVSLDAVAEPAEQSKEADAGVELASCLRPMVERLPAPYRDALVLTEFDGLTQQTLAEREGISLSGAKSRVQRGRERLKEMLLDCCRIATDHRGAVMACDRTDRSVEYCGAA